MPYHFGAFELDLDRYQLRHGVQVLHVEPRVLDLLAYLVRHRSRVVPKDELLDQVWKTRVVGESALSRCIMQARKALAADGRDEAVIQTHHRRGFRFMMDVTETPAVPGAAPVAGSVARASAETPADALCARALLLWKKRSPEGMREAVLLLQQAIECDPDHAPSYAALGDCYGFIGFLQQTAPSSVFPKARAAVARALALDPGLAEAHACRGFIETVYGWGPAAAAQACEQALQLDGRLAIGHHRLGLLWLAQRRFDDAAVALQRAAELDPLSPILATACGLPLMAAGQARAAVNVYRSVLESEPLFFPAHLYLGLALEADGQLDAAVAALKTAVEVTPAETEALPALAHVHARRGQRDEAAQILGRLHQAAQRRFISPFFYAVVAMGHDDHASALQHLEASVTMRAMRMHDLHLDPRFAPLHVEPRFQALLAHIGMDPLANQAAGPR